MNNNDILVIISTKNPTEYLIQQIKKINYLLPQSKIIIVDSDSTEFSYFKKVPDNVEIHYAKNKGYEWGAYKYAFNLYPSYKLYVCIQDTLILESLPITDKLYFYKDKCGFQNDHNSYPKAYNMLGAKPSLRQLCKAYRGLPFEICAHNSFIINHRMFSLMNHELPFVPICKLESQAMERIFGLWLLQHRFSKKMNDLAKITTKIHGKRAD
tara:strand:- start:2378 stop:3010 length:633 start_codon:yes stop_codon:yes gene_type:complete